MDVQLIRQFTPALDVQGFTHLDVSGTATQKFTLLIEYKVREGSKLRKVTESSYQSFSATMQASSIPILLVYEGAVDEITLMFYKKSEASQVAIESIRLSM
jgi:hypothetical protein